MSNHSSFWLPAAGRYYLADLSKLSKCFRSDSSECRVAAVAGSADRRRGPHRGGEDWHVAHERDRFGSRSLVREMNLPAPVVDPVLRASSGDELVAEGAVEVMLSELMPLAC